MQFHTIRRCCICIFLVLCLHWQTMAHASTSLLFLLSGVLAAAGDDAETSYNLSYPLVDTGQTSCYDTENEITCPVEGESYYGQDAQHNGAQFSFIDNGDQTVTDKHTGLMWQQVPSSAGYSWQEAVDYCNSLELAGYDDWRIPTLKELFSISDFSQGWPYIDTEYFHLASGLVTKDEQYWSSNFYHVGTTHGGAESAFGVNHVTGHIKAYPAEAGGPFGNYVRAVRGTDYGTNNLVDNGDGTVTDAATGLMWMHNDTGEAVDWQEALRNAESAAYAGHTDWRLPSVKELQGLVDYSGVFPAIDPLFTCAPITNEAGNADYGYYWSSTSALFQENGPYYYAWYVAFGRAVDNEGEDSHGAGAVRFDTKVEGGPLGEGGERYYNYVRLVRDV